MSVLPLKTVLILTCIFTVSVAHKEHKIVTILTHTHTHLVGGVAITRCVESTKLLYGGSG